MLIIYNEYDHFRTGKISYDASSDLDYETTSYYEVQTIVTDPSGLSDNVMVTINVIDVNEKPIIHNLPSSVHIAEDRTGEFSVFTANSSDDDNDLLTHTLEVWPQNAPFYITPSGTCIITPITLFNSISLI